MPVFFTLARHPELDPVVMPVEAVEHYPDWTAYGDPSVDPDALYAELAREQREKDPAFAPPAVSAPVPAAPSPAAAPQPNPSAPSSAENKE